MCGKKCKVARTSVGLMVVDLIDSPNGSHGRGDLGGRGGEGGGLCGRGWGNKVVWCRYVGMYVCVLCLFFLGKG